VDDTEDIKAMKRTIEEAEVGWEKNALFKRNRFPISFDQFTGLEQAEILKTFTDIGKLEYISQFGERQNMNEWVEAMWRLVCLRPMATEANADMTEKWMTCIADIIRAQTVDMVVASPGPSYDSAEKRMRRALKYTVPPRNSDAHIDPKKIVDLEWYGDDLEEFNEEAEYDEVAAAVAEADEMRYEGWFQDTLRQIHDDEDTIREEWGEYQRELRRERGHPSWD
jgi:hypothetical protein